MAIIISKEQCRRAVCVCVCVCRSPGHVKALVVVRFLRLICLNAQPLTPLGARSPHCHSLGERVYYAA